ncbi:MAG TPA: EI24 domain-containing protein [Burkholderiales bacterium]|nr:EI24 domain-containing protein [Burkholderiales bacterium]
MNSITNSLAYALANILHPRMIWLMIWPLVIALGLWGTLAMVFWAQLALALAEWMQSGLAHAPLIGSWDFTTATLFLAKVLILVMLVPLIQLTALLILSVFGMPSMVEHVASRSFTRLERRKGGSLAGSVWNSSVGLAGLVGLGIASIPLWVFPPLWPLIPVAILAWVNQRVLRYDALAEHAAADEMRRLFSARWGGLYVMGLVLALLAYIPILGFFAPVLLGVSFIHYLLGALEEQRGAPIEGQVV